MILEVTRRFVVVPNGDSWERNDITQTVWTYDTKTNIARVFDPPDPKVYVPGLLRCFAGGESVSIQDFEKHLASYTGGITKEMIVKSINKQ